MSTNLSSHIRKDIVADHVFKINLILYVLNGQQDCGGQSCQVKKREEEEEANERIPIVGADAIVQPWTVMIVTFDTFIA